MIRHYMVIQYQDELLEVTRRVLVSRTETSPERMYWSSGPGWCPWPEEYEVLADYGRADDRAYNPDHPEIRYRRDFPPLPYQFEPGSVRDALGLLSPEGTLYQCNYTGHTELAADLCISLYNEDVGDSEGFLYDLGWFRIGGDGYLSSSTDAPVLTAAQVKTLDRLILRAKTREPQYTKNLKATMRLFKREGTESETTERVCGPGIASVDAQ